MGQNNNYCIESAELNLRVVSDIKCKNVLNIDKV